MLSDDLYRAICEMPIIDVHSHLNRDNMAAPGLAHVLFYHMLLYPLRAAGMDEKLIWPSQGTNVHPETEAFDQALPYWQAVSDTSFGWALRLILRELYDFDEPVTAASLPRLRASFDARVAQADWDEQVRTKMNVRRILSSRPAAKPLAAGESDKGIRFTIESAPSGGTREYWTWPQRLRQMGQAANTEITTRAKLRRVVAKFYEKFDWADRHALVAWVSSEADFRPVSEAAMDGALAAAWAAGTPPPSPGATAGRPAAAGAAAPAAPVDADAAAAAAMAAFDPRAARIIEGEFIRAICLAIRGRTKTFQLCYGTQFLTPGPLHPVGRSAGQFASSFARLLGEFPDIHFNMLSGYEIDEPIWCSLCLGYANISLGGYWWGSFYPSVMHEAWHRRLDMVPTSRLCGFFSDGWCIDWTYARVRMTQRVLANVLAEKIDRGFCTSDQALRMVRTILFDTPKQLFLPEEQVE